MMSKKKLEQQTNEPSSTTIMDWIVWIVLQTDVAAGHATKLYILAQLDLSTALLLGLPKGNFGYKPYPLLGESSRAKQPRQPPIKNGHGMTPHTTPGPKRVTGRRAKKTTRKNPRRPPINDQAKTTRSFQFSTTRMPAMTRSNDKTQQWNINTNGMHRNLLRAS
uniref:Uncharacterized protein n=1 Tax=Romanomermis culicivorax TaxID=13658 RepID=A0A915J3C6_ROMCU